MGFISPKESKKEKAAEDSPSQKQKVADKNTLEIKASQFIVEGAKDIRETYDFQEMLGEGACGRVFKAKHKVSGELRAIKQIDKSKISTEKEEEMMNEIKILKTLVYCFL